MIQPSIRRRDPYERLRSHASAAASPAQPGQNFMVAVRLRPLIDRESRTNSQQVGRVVVFSPTVDKLLVNTGILQCVTVELEHRAMVITKPESKRRLGSYTGFYDIGDYTKLEQSQNFFFDVVFGPR